MRLFDTRTRAQVELVAAPTVRMYVCGITPYDATHLGHAFTYVAFDALIRYLEHCGQRVRYVRNVTDVDDDILRKARELDEPAPQLARREVERFQAELARLGLRPPDVTPWATRMVPAIVRAVGGLLARGSAYTLPDGRVYFDTGAATSFGALSRLDRSDMLAQFAEKGGDPDAQGKRDPLDFLLWQPSAPDEPSWPTPWGAGRPGWHIECSVMASEELGPVIDIHGGGEDLVFPHHEAEIVQAEHLTGQAPFARLWLHTGMVAYQGAKMSKSLGNLVWLSELLDRHDPAAVRRHLLSHHYRSGWVFDETDLKADAAAIERWREVAANDRELPGCADAFHAAMDDDLDTPTALAALEEAAAAKAGRTLRDLGSVLGLNLAG